MYVSIPLLNNAHHIYFTVSPNYDVHMVNYIGLVSTT